MTKQQRELFLFGDDFLGNIIEQYAFQIMRILKGKPIFETIREKLYILIESEKAHKKKRGFMLLEKGQEKHNSLVITQRNILKNSLKVTCSYRLSEKRRSFCPTAILQCCSGNRYDICYNDIFLRHTAFWKFHYRSFCNPCL